MPASNSSRPSSRRRQHDDHEHPTIDKLDYHPGGKPLLHGDAESSRRQSEDQSYAGSFFEDIAEGIADNDRRHLKRQVVRYGSFAWALINTLGAGSITAYSLYAPLFQRRLKYSQLQVNGVSITAELAMYLPVPLWGAACDRFGPGWPSLASGLSFGLGYLIAAFAYKAGPSPEMGGDGWPYWVMIVAYIFIGSGTSCMYLSAVTTCAKNFGRGKYKGVALALPIACFGLSGMWQSQVGSQLLYERTPDGGKGDVDVHRFFLFLGIFLLATGIVGFFALRIVDEPDFIEEAVEELEQSGLLEDSQFFRRSVHARDEGYGTLTHSQINELQREADEQKQRHEEEKRMKTWLLNAETHRFLTDRTMWWLAAGFFLVTGPGEAFINNLGTIIDTLYPPALDSVEGSKTTAATHVSIVAITSTIARIVTGTLTDLVAPTTTAHQHRRGPNSLANSMASLQPETPRRGLEISRVAFLIAFCIIMSVGQVLLASGFIQGHGERFWLVSAFIGAGYGAAFSLTPIIVSVIWGVENFGTNWGICAMVPALGATVWGLLYSAIYQRGANQDATRGQLLAEERLCYGMECYASTFWGMAICVWIACGFWMFAWKGPGGWARRGVAV